VHPSALTPNAAALYISANPVVLPSPAQPEAGKLTSIYGLANHGLSNLHRVYWNLPTASLYEEAVFRGEARISHLGPMRRRRHERR